jgi:hypothetical protein
VPGLQANREFPEAPIFAISVKSVPLKVKLQESVLQGPLGLLSLSMLMQSGDHLLDYGDVIELIAL